MAEIPKELKPKLFGKGPKWHANSMMALSWLGLVWLVLGIIGDAINRTIGLEATNWLVLAIALWVWGMGAWLAAYYGAKEG